jgi:hypothetical protein
MDGQAPTHVKFATNECVTMEIYLILGNNPAFSAQYASKSNYLVHASSCKP